MAFEQEEAEVTAVKIPCFTFSKSPCLSRAFLLFQIQSNRVDWNGFSGCSNFALFRALSRLNPKARKEEKGYKDAAHAAKVRGS